MSTISKEPRVVLLSVSFVLLVGGMGTGEYSLGQQTLLVLLCGWKHWGRNGDRPFPKMSEAAGRRKIEAQASRL